MSNIIPIKKDRGAQLAVLRKAIEYAVREAFLSFPSEQLKTLLVSSYIEMREERLRKERKAA